MRTIKLKLLTQSDLAVINTDARTFGEFKAEPAVSELGIAWDSSKLIDFATKVSFDLDNSLLPEADSLMFVTPTKTKAGYKDLPYKEVKRLIKEYKEEGGVIDFNYSNATTEQLNEFWRKASKLQKTAAKIQEEVEEEPVDICKCKTETVDGAKLLIEETKSLMEKALANLAKLDGLSLGEISKEIEAYKNSLALYITKDELEEEARYLASQF